MHNIVEGVVYKVLDGFTERIGLVDKVETNVRIDANTVEDVAYSFDIAIGHYVQISRTPRSNPLYTLEEVKQRKLADLATKCDAEIHSSFTSLAMGPVKTYGYSVKAADNFRAETALLGIDSMIDSVNWATVEDGFILHTRAQFIQVIKDGANHDRTLQMKFYTLEAQIKAATTIDAVNAIIW